MKDAHKRAAKVLGYALTLDSKSGWNSTAAIWAARLTMGERAALALAALGALDPAEAEFVASQALSGAGAPLPPFLDPLDDAAWWADLASPAELRAYALAAFLAMSRRDQVDFLEYAQGAGNERLR